MTPTATQLKLRLDQCRLWFENEWLFKWHHIGRQSVVEIDTFDGRMARYGGIKFGGSARLVFWDAITRGVRKEVIEQLAWVEDRVRLYDRRVAEQAIDECANLIIAFAQSVRLGAIQKDRVLRGDGFKFPPEQDSGRWMEASATEIKHQAEALKASLFPPPPNESLHRHAQRNKNHRDYQVALSFAGEQRNYVEKVAQTLRSDGIDVFYDQFDITNLWGKDGVEFFNHLFEHGAQCVVMFISRDYVSKEWTRLERRAALVRAMAEDREYVLPVRFDDSVVSGLPGSIQYLKAVDYSPQALARIISDKIRNLSI